jgi:hypothetical protein
MVKIPKPRRSSLVDQAIDDLERDVEYVRELETAPKKMQSPGTGNRIES